LRGAASSLHRRSCRPQQQPNSTTPAAPRPSPVAAAAAAAAVEAPEEGPPSSRSALNAAIEKSFLSVFAGDLAAGRVLDSWRRLQEADAPFQKDWPGLGVQQAISYLEGLPEPPPPFPDVNAEGHEWLVEVERSAGVIIEEFEKVMADPAALEAAGNAVW
jgi:hypothetical protein